LAADGKRLFSGSHDQTIKVWDLQEGKETLTLRGRQERRFLGLQTLCCEWLYLASTV
jgi:WD40 repeat protein